MDSSIITVFPTMHGQDHTYTADTIETRTCQRRAGKLTCVPLSTTSLASPWIAAEELFYMPACSSSSATATTSPAQCPEHTSSFCVWFEALRPSALSPLKKGSTLHSLSVSSCHLPCIAFQNERQPFVCAWIHTDGDGSICMDDGPCV